MSSDHYPRFETGTPAAQYQQIINFSINYLEGLLVEMAHMELPPEFEPLQRQYLELQQKLVCRERTVRHGFQYQIEKLFTEFRTFRRSRLNANRSSDWSSLGLAGHSSSQVLSTIERISGGLQKQFERRVFNLNRRLKSLVHRNDDNLGDNPLSPENLCHAFLSSVDALNLTSLQTCRMFDLFELALRQQLKVFYNQLDLGLYYLDVLPELTDSSLFLIPDELQDSTQDNLESSTAVAEDQITEVAGLAAEHAEQAIEKVPSSTVDMNQPEASDASSTAALTATDTDTDTDTEQDAIDDQSMPVAESRAADLNEHIEALEHDSQHGSSEQQESTSGDAAEAPAVDFERTLPDFELAQALEARESDSASPDDKQTAVEQLLFDFQQRVKNGFDDHAEGFLALHKSLNPLLTDSQIRRLRKFTHYYANLLSSPRLSEDVSIQLSRLSGMLSELVLNDPGFFTDDTHVVQNFINSIVDFEIRCTHGGDSLSDLTRIIDELVELKRSDADAFEPLADEYESMKKNEIQFIIQQKNDKKKLEGQLKDDVLNLIKTSIANLPLEEATHAFFYDDWQLLLLQLGKKIGRDSREYQQASDITRMLGSALGNTAIEQAEQFQGVAFPSLLKAVDKGLESLGYGSEHRTRVRKQLIGEFRKRNIKDSGDEGQHDGDQVGMNTVELFSSTIQSHSSRLSDIHTPPKSAAPAESDTMLACELEIGAWVEMSTGNNGKTFKRAKLKWKSKSRDQFIFVDQRGHKVRQLNEDELDKELADGRVKPLKLGSSAAPKKKKPASKLGSGFHFYH